MEIDEVIKSILNYLREHPDAGDTVEGIIRWWILQERIETKTRKVWEAVRVLVSRGILNEKKLGDNSIVYSISRNCDEALTKLLIELDSRSPRGKQTRSR